MTYLKKKTIRRVIFSIDIYRKIESEGIMYKIFIVEDDFSLAEIMEKCIRSWGNDAKTVSDFQEVLHEFNEYDPQLVLMDIMLPYFNGYHWCQEIRKISNVPIVFISSASDNMNIVMAMNMGGDDFIQKPFDQTVFMAKLQAMLRRTYDMGGKVNILEHRGVMLNLNDSSFVYNGEKIELTKNEYRILQTLMESKGKVVSRETLMTKLWQMDCYVEENTLTVNVNRLRKKLDSAGVDDFIKTKVGQGYIVE